MGVLSALPLVSALNFCCCLWIVSGGVVAAYVLQQNQTTPVSAGDGAIAGLLAGVVGTIVLSVISIPIGLLLAPITRSLAERLLNMPASNVPPELRAMIENYSNPQNEIGIVGQVVFRVVAFFMALVVFAVVSTIGGLLGAALFARRRPPPEPTLS